MTGKHRACFSVILTYRKGMNFSYTNLQKRIWALTLTMGRSAILLTGFLFLPLVLSAASLQIEGERAWLEADNEPLSEVLLLFEQQGIKVSIDPSIKLDLVSGNWSNVDIGWLIGQLGDRHSYILKWKQGNNDLGDQFQLSAIQLFPEGDPSAARPLSSQEKSLDVIEGENGIKYIRGEILVGFNKNSSINELKGLLNKINGTIIEVIDPPGLYRIKIDNNMTVETAILIAEKHENVTTTEPNLAFSMITSNMLPWPLPDEDINLNLTPSESIIAVLDSGLDPAYTAYPFIRGTYNAIDPTAEISDPTGHGTLTSLIAAGAITPIGANAAQSGVPVLSIRSFDKNGFTSSDTILRALAYATNSGAKVISMSWGTEVSSHFLETAMNFATQNGITLYAAAGNEPTGTPVYPAGYGSVIAVGGLNPDGSKWEKSNYGDFVDYYEPALATFNNTSYAGTSIASPYAAFKAAQTVSE
jgi:thermitase